MRLWSIHPKYLDSRGLVALWREGLLAQAVLRGRTEGYRQHPQLHRFREQSSPVGFIASYLAAVHEEALSRGYNFDAQKIGRARAAGNLTVTRGQIEFEWNHLMEKLKVRDPDRHKRLKDVRTPEPHPLFRIVSGGVASWEKGAGV